MRGARGPDAHRGGGHRHRARAGQRQLRSRPDAGMSRDAPPVNVGIDELGL
jgi:hypothetical protein